MRQLSIVLLSLCLAAGACGGGGGTGTSGGNSGGGTSTGGAGSSSGGISSGGSGGDPQTCSIDGGIYTQSQLNPDNPCQVCNPNVNGWSPALVCNRCVVDAGSGICTLQGDCCTTRCTNNGTCAGQEGSSCSSASDCCGIPPQDTPNSQGC